MHKWNNDSEFIDPHLFDIGVKHFILALFMLFNRSFSCKVFEKSAVDKKTL